MQEVEERFRIKGAPDSRQVASKKISVFQELSYPTQRDHPLTKQKHHWDLSVRMARIQCPSGCKYLNIVVWIKCKAMVNSSRQYNHSAFLYPYSDPTIIVIPHIKITFKKECSKKELEKLKHAGKFSTAKASWRLLQLDLDLAVSVQNWWVSKSLGKIIL